VEEGAVVPISPLITVSIPELVIPAPPPKAPKGAAAPRGKGATHAADAVVKVQGFGTSPGDPNGMPATSVTAPEIVTVYTVSAARLFVGVKVMIVPVMSWENTPVMGTVDPGGVTVKVVVLNVAAFIGILKVALMVALKHTPVARFPGLVETKMGAMTTETVPVVKVHGFGGGVAGLDGTTR
jgi:hypothetical protein